MKKHTWDWLLVVLGGIIGTTIADSLESDEDTVEAKKKNRILKGSFFAIFGIGYWLVLFLLDKAGLEIWHD
jgi:uncharacterized membrane-anchored protein